MSSTKARRLSARLSAPLGCAHCLLNHHETTWQQTQASQALGIGLQLLLHTRCHVEILFHEGVHHRRRTGRAHDLRLLEFAAQVQVVGAAGPTVTRTPCRSTSSLRCRGEASRTI